jgi:hypothetical protein
VETIVYDWRELCRLSDADLAKVDVAEMNLACSVGLPGAEVINVSPLPEDARPVGRCRPATDGKRV